MSIVPSAEASETRLPDSCEKCGIDDGISSRKVNEPQAPATAEPCRFGVGRSLAGREAETAQIVRFWCASTPKALTECVRPSNRLRGDRVAPSAADYVRHRVDLAVRGGMGRRVGVLGVAVE
jgi:hypothetical protein